MPIELDTVVRRSSQIMHSDLGEESVMMDLDAGAYYGLNAVGSRIWALTEEPVALTTIVERLLAEFDVTRADCETAVATFVSRLIDQNIIEVVEPPC